MKGSCYKNFKGIKLKFSLYGSYLRTAFDGNNSYVFCKFTTVIPCCCPIYFALKFLRKTYVILIINLLGMQLRSFITNRFLSLEGRLYSGNLSEVQYKIESALDKTQSLIVSLDHLEKIDEAGAYMLYIASEKARENDKQIILFCKENEMVKIVFKLVGIHYYKRLPRLIS